MYKNKYYQYYQWFSKYKTAKKITVEDGNVREEI